MRNLLATSATSAFLIAALALAGPVHARSGATTTDAGSNAAADSLTTGSIGTSQTEKRQRQFDDCMAIWEPATHMTKKQWQRTCRSSLEELPNL
jgi:hypothetical protein